MKRKKIVAGNWKMNKDFEEGLSLASEIIPMVGSEAIGEVLTILIPPFVHVHAIASLCTGQPNMATGAQDCSAYGSGAFTGEVSAQMVKSSGAEYVLVGHSERRQYHQETNKLCRAKIDQALSAGLSPIYCIGELKEERLENRVEEVIVEQLAALDGLSNEDISRIILAYEPVWAIGTGLTASPEQAQEVHALIRGWIRNYFGAQAANGISILYGGSVNAANAKQLFAMPDIDGGLIGGASLKSRDFTEIVKANI
jgi:triosephosphate isomerase (TIM)